MQPLRCAPRPRVCRRPAPNRPALLHQFRVPEIGREGQVMPSQSAVASSNSRLHRNSLWREFLRIGIFAGLLSFAVASLPAPARAWGCEGHQVVALLAEKHLTPHALAVAKKILADGPIDPSLSRYCKQ